MSERVMSGKVGFLPSEPVPQTWFAALLFKPDDLLFQSDRKLCHKPCHKAQT